VVADPPRAGLARELVDYLTTERSAERFAYVSCDPATLARDLGLLIGGGWRVDGLRAFDAFPMTHHVECVVTLTRLKGVGLARAARRVLRLAGGRSSDHVIPESGVADEEPLFDQQAKRLGTGLPGVTVLLAEGGDRWGGRSWRIRPVGDRPPQVSSEPYVRSWV
jgi:hypothetical protein